MGVGSTRFYGFVSDYSEDDEVNFEHCKGVIEVNRYNEKNNVMEQSNAFFEVKDRYGRDMND